MKTLVKTKNLSRKEWLYWRTKGIGGSDVSVIFGVNKFRSVYQLWMEKTGQIEALESENEYIHFGNVLEPIVKREFMERTGKKIRAKHAMLQSSDYPFMLADLDGVIYENGKMCIFEAKTASEYKKEVWEDGVPFEYVLQVQHYMAVTGAEKTYIAAIVGGNSFYYHEVLRDELLIRKIIEAEKQFWEENVLAGVEPAADGSKATTAWLSETYDTSNGQSIELPSEALLLFEQYDSVVDQIDVLTTAKDKLSNQLKSYLKENEEGYIADRRVSWKMIQRKDFDKKLLQAEHPELYQSYLRESKYRRLSVA